jgi:hypothetical protein
MRHIFINGDVDFINKKTLDFFSWSYKNHKYVPIIIDEVSNSIFREIMKRFYKIILTATR